ncbi:glutathione S-transferase domain-containing protein [Caballeronia fortuita]|uniref:Glutathione S-transferase domain-containing protein n=1 Tax=Caballeronia fortuita TaxID=1777138 RepID=A0A158A6T5_9BURK|nr:glutathione S-transferase family protein [Caballeronia fortuita]SAK53483.1 glutathione S-transferase domain-containing protein [Caballeronia fortuita]
MKLFLNTTSPYARIARISFEEKIGSDVPGEVVDPWADAPALLEVNPAARVPALVTNDGVTLTESLLIVLWLESQRPSPSLLGDSATRTIAKAGVAMGVIDAAVHTLIGRKITDAGFDEAPVGLRRRRSMVNGLLKLEQDPPTYEAGTPDLAAITAVVALDYVRFRFPKTEWMPSLPELDALRNRLSSRPSFEHSVPKQ